MSMCVMKSLVKCDPFHKPSNEDSAFTRIILITGIGYFSTLLAVFFLVSEEVPEPYMDEIFHVQQARAYFVGNFTQVCQLTHEHNYIHLYRSAVESENHNATRIVLYHSGCPETVFRTLCFWGGRFREDLSNFTPEVHQYTVCSC